MVAVEKTAGNLGLCYCPVFQTVLKLFEGSTKFCIIFVCCGCFEYEF